MPRVPPVTTATRAMTCPFVFPLEKTVQPHLRGVSTKRTMLQRNRSVSYGPPCRVAIKISTFNRQRNSHPAADTQRGETFFGIALAHLEQQRGQDARAARSDGMADGDGATI